MKPGYLIDNLSVSSVCNLIAVLNWSVLNEITNLPMVRIDKFTKENYPIIGVWKPKINKI